MTAACAMLGASGSRHAAIWGARNPASNVIVLYDEYYQSMGEAPTHAAGIKARGDWIPGVIDPASYARSIVDGRALLGMYRELGLKLSPALRASTMLAVAVHSLADFNLYVPANALAFAWLAGLSTGLVPGPSRIAS